VPLIDRVPERFAWRLKALRMSSDLATFRRLALITRTDEDEVEVRLSLLGGEPVRIRPGTADVWTVLDLVPPQHMPPPGLSPRLVWDLGANIGLSMAHMAAVFAEARIVGVELDAANAELCRRNVAPWGDRCEVIEGAVFPREGEFTYHHQEGMEVGYRVDAGAGPEDAEERRARAVTLNSLLGRYDADAVIDFVKMDIEGAEREVLRENVEWADRVRSIRVEVHPPYTVPECLEDLRALGFDAWRDEVPLDEGAGEPVTAVRPAGHPLAAQPRPTATSH
jgi:FkbM family methyltransferase